jgi:hypothetical protein
MAWWLRAGKMEGLLEAVFSMRYERGPQVALIPESWDSQTCSRVRGTRNQEATVLVWRLNFCWHSPAQSFFISYLVEIYDQWDLLFDEGGVGLFMWALRLLHRSLFALSQRPGLSVSASKFERRTCRIRIDSDVVTSNRSANHCSISCKFVLYGCSLAIRMSKSRLLRRIF